jgi:hypothetical protein
MISAPASAAETAPSWWLLIEGCCRTLEAMSLRLALGALALILLVPGVARADIASLRAEIHGGAGGGVGVGGDQKDDAFSEGQPPGVYGALVGAELLFIDAYLEHHQFTDGDDLSTWTQLGVGFDVDIDLGAPPQLKGEPPKPGKGYLELGLYAAFGVGTGQQVDPPLDNSEITDKGFLLEARVGVGWRLGRFARLGLTVPVSGGYFLKSGEGAGANDVSTHYQAIQAAALLTMRFDLVLK